MYCKYCGNEYEFGSKFCTDCGARIEEEPVRGAPYYTFDDTMPDPFEEEKSNKARSILALGICSLAFSTTFFAIVGWILAVICRSKVRSYEARFGPATGMAKVGKGLSLGGLIAGIVMTIFVTLYIALLIVAIFSEGGGSYEGDPGINMAYIINTFFR